MRWVGYFFAGGVAWLGLHVLIVWNWAPRDSVVAPPVELSRTPLVPGEATLLFAGDTAEIDAALPTLRARGFDLPFARTLDLVRGADVAIANLEAPITDDGVQMPVYTRYQYRAPSLSARALAEAGFDLVTMANNHALDFGAEGLADSERHLQAAGVAMIGAGPSDGIARRGAIVTVGGLRVGILAYCEDQLFFRVWMDLFARRGHRGVAALSRDNLADDIARLRPNVDVVVVALHAGYNYSPPRAGTVSWGERAIDDGADLVVVHHPHVGHPVALHQGKPILLSLGNYAFGTPGRSELDYGWLALVHATGKKLDRIELVPLAVQNARVAFQPVPLDGEERDRAIAALAAASQKYGAALHEERGRAILDLK
jgi:poly-gamma-glutamate capsule biosynthesis protein CapA/YwtB (metallophosphatase superfamily)